MIEGGARVVEQIFYTFLFILDFAYVRVILEGHALRTKRRMQPGTPANIHRWNAYFFLLWLVLLVLAIEIYVQMIGGSVFDSLLWTHLGMAGPLFVVSFLMLHLSGERNRKRHRQLARLSAILMIGVNITGIPLIHIRF